MQKKLKIGRLNYRKLHCEWGSSYCSGHYEAYKHAKGCPVWGDQECSCYVKNLTFVSAHCLPVWVQCSGCGIAPVEEKQAALLGKVLFGGLRKTTKLCGKRK